MVAFRGGGRAVLVASSLSVAGACGSSFGEGNAASGDPVSDAAVESSSEASSEASSVVAPEVLATGQNDAYGIAVDATAVYSTSPGDAAIRALPKSSTGQPMTVHSGGGSLRPHLHEGRCVHASC